MAAPKRFWKAAQVEPEGEGWGVRLDGRPVRTPSGHLLVAPTRALAEATAQEWDAQTERLDPRTMPLTRTLNTVIERVTPKPEEVADAIAAYAEADLLCYRAPHPKALADRQAEAWEPWLDWAERRHGARMVRAEGIMHVAQPPEFVAALREAARAHGPFQLAALHEFVDAVGVADPRACGGGAGAGGAGGVAPLADRRGLPDRAVGRGRGGRRAGRAAPPGFPFRPPADGPAGG